MSYKLQQVTRDSLFDYLQTVNDSEDRPYGVSLDVFKSWTDAQFYIDTKKATAAEHRLPETLFVIRQGDDRKLHWSVYAVHDHSVRVVEEGGNVTLKGVEFGMAWPTEIKYLMSGTVEGASEMVIDYCWGYTFLLLDDLARDLKSVSRIVKHFLFPNSKGV